MPKAELSVQVQKIFAEFCRVTKDETSKDGQEMLSELHLTVSPENVCNLRGLAALDGKAGDDGQHHLQLKQLDFAGSQGYGLVHRITQVAVTGFQCSPNFLH